MAAPSGIVAGADVAERLGHLGAQHKFNPGAPVELLSKEFTNNDASKSSVKAAKVTVVTPSKPSDQQTAPLFATTWGRIKPVQKPQQKCLLSMQESPRKEEKRGQEGGREVLHDARPFLHGWCCRRSVKDMVHQGDIMNEIFDRYLAQLNPVAGARANARIFLEVKSCNKIINLKWSK